MPAGRLPKFGRSSDLLEFRKYFCHIKLCNLYVHAIFSQMNRIYNIFYTYIIIIE